MTKEREEFLNGVLALSYAMRAVNLDPEAITVVLSERDGRMLENILTQSQNMIVSSAFDQRYSSPNADKHIREFTVGGVKFQYKVKPLVLPK